MKIGGLDRNSLLDFQGYISAVIFTQGCNFDCSFCHNRHLIPKNTISENLKFEEDYIMELLDERKEFLDAVVITGGEPLLQNDLVEFITKIKNLGYLVKLDTNGFLYKRLGDLINKKLVDYIAMDIKAPFEKYSEVISENIIIDNIKKSIDVIMNSDINYEFRTTFTKELEQEDLLLITENIVGAMKYSIQQCREVGHRLDLETGWGHTGKNINKTINKYIYNKIKSNVQELRIIGDTLLL